MIEIETLKNTLMVAMSAGIIVTTFVQKLKSILPSKKHIIPICIVSSLLIGVLFSISFSDLNIYNSLWVGLITFIGADTIYKLFENKIFPSYTNVKQYVEIKRNDE